MDPPRYRGRFAPSPTGPLHFGSLVAALGSYCDARAARGDWMVRIEDVDLPRARRGADALILRTLERYGFAWDGPVVRQSQRTGRYREALEELQRANAVFPCSCTRRMLAGAPAGISGEALYPGTCRQNPPSTAGTVAWRLRVDAAPAITFVDRLQGAQTQDLAHEVGDFVLQRSDGLFAYQLAVVVDDADQGITDVVRGADLLTSTARQIYLQSRLDLPAPRYLHLPVAINAVGEKLSKQTGAAPLPDDPLPALRAAWQFLDQPAPDRRPASVDEFWRHAIAAWAPGRLPPVRMLPAPAAFGPGAGRPL